MHKAFGVIELLVIVVVIVVIYFACFHSQYGRSNPFVTNVNDIKTKQQLIDDKLEEIGETRQLQQKFDQDLNEGY